MMRTHNATHAGRCCHGSISLRQVLAPPKLRLLSVVHVSPAKGVPNPDPSALADKLFSGKAAPEAHLGPISVVRPAGVSCVFHASKPKGTASVPLERMCGGRCRRLSGISLLTPPHSCHSGRGRGLGATKTLQAGDLLLVSPPLAVVTEEDLEARNTVPGLDQKMQPDKQCA